MRYDRIDHIVLPVRSLAEAAAPFARLGLTLYPGVRHEGRGTENTGFFVGDAANEFYVELLAVHNAAEARAAGLSHYLEAAEQGRGLSRVALRVDSFASGGASSSAGMEPRPQAVYAADGRKVCDAAELGDPARSHVELLAIQYPEDDETRYQRHASAGLFKHDFPLKRLDHLAVMAPDLEATTRYWTDVLGIPPAGEVATPAMVIRQMRVGDAVIELLGPATPDSPMAQRPPGPASMAAFEVEDLDAAVAQAQRAGFTPSEPRAGVLPGTRVATIPAGELSGLALQLLEYV